MSFGGYNPSRSPELPFSTASGVRSRTSSFSSVHSNHSHQGGGAQSHPPPPPPLATTLLHHNQQPQQSPHQSPYSSQPGTPGSAGAGVGHGADEYFGRNSGYASGGGGSSGRYDGYGSDVSSPGGGSSGFPSPVVPIPIRQHQVGNPSMAALPTYQRRGVNGGANNNTNGGIVTEDAGYGSGYDSSTGVSSSVPYALNYSSHTYQQGHHQQSHHHHQQQHHHSQQQQPQQYYPRQHSRTHSNASETSLSIETGIPSYYGPGPASLSSAPSSRRGSISEAGSGSGSGGGGGFFARKKPTFRPPLHQDADNDDDDDLNDLGTSKLSPRRLRQKRMSKKANGKSLHAGNGLTGSSRIMRMSGILNDWDLLLPSSDNPYDDDDDYEEEDESMTENERWKRRQLTKRGWDSARGQRIILATLIVVAVFVRIWKLAIPAAVVFDEQHFGGFTSDYLKGEFFMDVHPPLGKMLFSLVAYLLGYDGKFSFALRKLYTKNVPYIGMRMFAVACGVGLTPISYLTIKRSGHSTQAALVCAILVTFENALITQSRLILLDAPMLLFMGYTMLAWINFYNYRNRPFTRGWWVWLIQTGVALFLSSSVKWVGLFTITTIGLCVLKYLQESRQHLYLNTRNFSKMFVALLICLLVLPCLLYMGLYAVDFRLLPNSGSGNSWVSPQFQMTLKNHDVQPVMADIAWESKVHIRHSNTNGGWLHSMLGEYARDGSIDQAIQLVEWDDELTCWELFPADAKLAKEQRQRYYRKMDPAPTAEDFVYDGDILRLKHCHSRIELAINDLPSIGSNKSFIREVRGVHLQKETREETTWRVELVPEGFVPGLADQHGVKSEAAVETGGDKPGASVENEDDKTAKGARDMSKQWHAIKGFRLFNEKLNCYLMSHKVFRSPFSTYQEVGCVQGNRQKANTIFIIDRNVNSNLPATTPSISYQPLNFFQKFIELNRVMWWTHHDLSSPIHGDDIGQSKKKSDESSPWSWPFLSRGLNYYSSKETNHYVYLLGNPVVWWGSSLAAIWYMVGCLWSVVNFIRAKPELKMERDRFGLTPFYSVASGTFYAGWAIHYFPFFFMNRQLYLHHYLPALYFSILLLVSRVDRTWQRWSKKVRYTAGLLFIAAIVLSWHSLSPLAYGTDFSSRAKCEKVRSLGGWEFVCQRQNLAWARPQAAKIVVEKRSDHEQHEAREEAENSKFYYRDPALEDQEEDGHESHLEGDDNHDHDHDHDYERDGDEGEVELDHAGPFNLDDSAHYDHEHFHHPHGKGHGHGHSHGHQYHNAAMEKKGHHHSHDKKPAAAAAAPAQPASPPPPVPEQQIVQEAVPTDTAEAAPETPSESPKTPPEFKEAHQSEAEKMMAAAAMRAKEVHEKNALVQEKEALEAKQRELEERLEAQTQEIERQRQLHVQHQRELEERVAEQARLARERDEIQKQYQQQQEQQKADAGVEAEKERERQRVIHELTEKHLEAKQEEQEGASKEAGDAAAIEAKKSREALEEQVRQLQAQLESHGQHVLNRKQEL
ncbi:dolichyl-phosphate-mannose-protein mannosyltransferase [Entomortierella parvispora]|uniref:dolichyl-phosphate-mannose--protein mannosyltransferase n=1 Tax=Entomortierella parvispora TaxID=205924 RepID=A0A9P3LS46_9FUNG|nr:dolichyl-phosphate-mannose-protein mannosyltransferase [Entomortierella parvispora]